MRHFLIASFDKFGQSIFLMLCLLLLSACPRAFCDDDYSRLTERLERLGTGSVITTVKIGCSEHGRPIYSMIMSDSGDPFAYSQSDTRILVISGQHGNEQTAVYAVLDLLEKLSRKHSKNLHLKDTTIAFVPVVNPDGFAADTRSNEIGTDLNRNWISGSQPETKAVDSLIRRFRPHMLIDLHEWVSCDSYRPNCIEVAGFGDGPGVRLARLLTLMLKQKSWNGLSLQPVYYRQTSDGRLAHRWFTEHGGCGMLVETSPEWPVNVRAGVYQGFLEELFRLVEGPSTSAVESNLAELKAQSPCSADMRAFALTRNYRGASSLNAKQAACWVGVFLAVLYAAFNLVPRQKRAEAFNQAAAKASSRASGRMFPITEVARYDLPVRTRLSLIHQHRIRPTDRV